MLACSCVNFRIWESLQILHALIEIAGDLSGWAGIELIRLRERGVEMRGERGKEGGFIIYQPSSQQFLGKRTVY